METTTHRFGLDESEHVVVLHVFPGLGRVREERVGQLHQDDRNTDGVEPLTG